MIGVWLLPELGESNNKLILKYEKEYEGAMGGHFTKTDDGYLFISNQKAD